MRNWILGAIAVVLVGLAVLAVMSCAVSDSGDGTVVVTVTPDE